MTKSERVDFLVKVADFLDRNNQHDLADMADSLLADEVKNSPSKELEVEIPEEEYEILKEIYKALGRSFQI